MIEIGAILGNISQKIESVVNSWLTDQVEIYNKLHDYNINKTGLFPNDPVGLKCFVPTAMYSVSPVHGSTTSCEFLDSDTVIFCAQSPILNTYTISTETFSDDIVPHTSFSASGLYGYRPNFNTFFKTSTGYVWQKTGPTNATIQYTSDNFATVNEITPYVFPTTGYRPISSYSSGDNFIITYLLPIKDQPLTHIPTHSQNIVDVTYNISTATASMGTEIPYSFSLINSRSITKIWYGSTYEPGNFFVKKIDNYILLYHNYGYRSGFFLIDITGTDTYWYYIDPVFLEMYRRSYMQDSWGRVTSTMLGGVHDIKKFGDDLYFVFDVNLLELSYNYACKEDSNFILCKMETV